MKKFNDMSVHNEILAIYTRDLNNNKTTTFSGKYSGILYSFWNKINELSEPFINEFGVSERKAFIEPSIAKEFTGTDLAPYFEFRKDDDSHKPVIKFCEIQLSNENQTRGLAVADINQTVFGKWFIAHILHYSDLRFGEVVAEPGINNYTKLITDLFDRELRNVTRDDQWAACGREYFEKTVNFFTSRNLRIEACLPAFPAKSTNTDKVAGISPDKGEELALRRLSEIIALASKVYPPGIKIWIISDGHVFSDCVGIDDPVVDIYGKKLKDMKNTIISDDFVDFRSLPQILTNETHEFDQTLVEGVIVPHYLETIIENNSELCRKIMMTGCHTSDEILRHLIDTQNPAKLALYRGFTKFMEEDLALHPTFIKKGTRKGCKKIAQKCAFEMIKRNEAYSNLVELMFPHHLRLSIHAHCNSGPKFGIKLLSTKECHPIKSLDDESLPTFDDLLHIPTPWHNCIIKVEGRPQFFAARSRVAHEGIKSGKYEGEWVEGSTGNGGYYLLKKKDSPMASSTSLLLEKPSAMVSIEIKSIN